MCGWSLIFSPRLTAGLAAVDDRREAGLSDFHAATLLWAGILMFVCRLGARRRMRFAFGGPRATACLRALSGQENLGRFPHGDTLRDFLLALPERQTRLIGADLVRSLIENRRLERARLLERYYIIAMDGTGWLSMGCAPSQFTEGCLTRSLADGRALYYRPVLEAKLVTRSGMALSVETEFCENPPRADQSEEDFKQDCEHSGAKRLLPRLKEAFPRLDVCLLLDGLYADGPIMRLCRKLDWRFIIVLKEGRLPGVHEEFRALIALAPENRMTVSARKTEMKLAWVNDIAYQNLKLHVLECVETDRTRIQRTARWLWVTDIPVTKDNAVELALSGGRQRWRIENEGFNAQKNGGWEMEHAYALAPRAARNFYLLLQIAHILAQMFECLMGGKKKVAMRFGSLQDLASGLLESIRNDPMPRDCLWEAFMNTPIQVRLNPATDTS